MGVVVLHQRLRGRSRLLHVLVDDCLLYTSDGYATRHEQDIGEHPFLRPHRQPFLGQVIDRDKEGDTDIDILSLIHI